MRKHRGRVEDRSRRVCALKCKAMELRILRFQCYRLACGLQLRLKPFRHLARRGSTIGCSRVLPVDLQAFWNSFREDERTRSDVKISSSSASTHSTIPSITRSRKVMLPAAGRSNGCFQDEVYHRKESTMVVEFVLVSVDENITVFGIMTDEAFDGMVPRRRLFLNCEEGSFHSYAYRRCHH